MGTVFVAELIETFIDDGYHQPRELWRPTQLGREIRIATVTPELSGASLDEAERSVADGIAVEGGPFHVAAGDTGKDMARNDRKLTENERKGRRWLAEAQNGGRVVDGDHGVERGEIGRAGIPRGRMLCGRQREGNIVRRGRISIVPLQALHQMKGQRAAVG